MDDAVVTLLRKTLESDANGIGKTELPVAWSARTEPARSPRWRVLTLVACAALVATSAVVVATRAGDPPQSPPGAIDETNWYLPTDLPDGYELTGIAARTDSITTATTRELWVSTDGSRTTGFVEAASNDPTTLPGTAYQPGDRPSVHGVRATVLASEIYWEPNPGDVGYAIEWTEHHVRFTISSAGVTYEELLAMAESSTVADDEVTLNPASVPSGFERVELTRYPEGVYDQVLLSVSPSAFDGSRAIHTSIRDSDSPLDAVVRHETERRVVDDVEYSIAVEGLTASSTYSRITWVTGGHMLQAEGMVDAETMLEFVTGLRPASATEADEAIELTAARRESIPEIDRATLADGSTAIARGDAESGRVDALCLSVGEPTCQRVYSEAPTSDLPTYFAFNLERGGRHVLGWHHAQPDVVTSPGAEAETVAGELGWFVSVPVAADATLPEVEYQIGSVLTDAWVVEPDYNWP